MAQILVTLCTLGVGSVWGLVEGILILGSHPGSPWHLDATGRDLMD